MKHIRYWLEHIGLIIFHFISKILGYPRASDLFGNLAALIGPQMAMNRKPIRHIQSALGVYAQDARMISEGHWANLGRVMAEFPHLKTIAEKYVEFRGIEHIEKLRDDEQPGVLFGAHLANWEIIPHALLYHCNFKMHPVYRAPNNPMVDKRLHSYRSPDGTLIPYSKSRQGMVGMVKALKAGEHLGMLIDQKYNEGVDAPFFGMNARTGTAFIELTQKYKCPLVPIRCIRENNCFIIDVHPPVETEEREVLDVLAEAHSLLESWIREYPEQWLWVHKRWRSEDLKSK